MTGEPDGRRPGWAAVPADGRRPGWAADMAGRALRSIDRLCAIGFLGFSLWLVWDLWERATVHGPAILLPAVPVVVSTLLLAPSVFGRGGDLLRPTGPRRWRPTGPRRWRPTGPRRWRKPHGVGRASRRGRL